MSKMCRHGGAELNLRVAPDDLKSSVTPRRPKLTDRSDKVSLLVRLELHLELFVYEVHRPQSRDAKKGQDTGIGT